MTHTRTPPRPPADRPPAAGLYLADEVAWLDIMSALAAAGRADLLDLPNLAEFLHDMATRERREVKSRLIVLLAHLLKCQYQPDKHTRSWDRTIRDQRRELVLMLDSGSLRNHAAAELEAAYRLAVKEAAAEAELPPETFPADCPFTLEAALGEAA